MAENVNHSPDTYVAKISTKHQGCKWDVWYRDEIETLKWRYGLKFTLASHGFPATHGFLVKTVFPNWVSLGVSQNTAPLAPNVGLFLYKNNHLITHPLFTVNSPHCLCAPVTNSPHLFLLFFFEIWSNFNKLETHDQWLWCWLHNKKAPGA